MIGASRLSGDTLIACHLPVVQLPTWRLPVQALCGSAKRSGRLCSAGLTRAVSLPERQSLNREHALAAGRKHFSSSHGSLNEERAEEEGASDSSGRYDSASSPEETDSCPKKDGVRAAHNSFLPSAELEEDDEDSDGDNLHRYHEDSSFVLHGNSNWPPSDGVRGYPAPRGDLDGEWSRDLAWLSGRPRWLDPPSSGEQGPDRLEENASCCARHQYSLEYVSDSSCNSSDGVSVNFCTMYKGSNNPATPQDLSGPAAHPSQWCDGSVFLHLQPVPRTLTADLPRGAATVSSPPREEADVTPSASCWSPRGLDSNCSLYSPEPLPPGLSSLEVSDLTACLQSQSSLATGTNQKYYKLVSCDLPSQSPSPAWSSLTSRSSPLQPSEPLVIHHKKEHQETRKTFQDMVEPKEPTFSPSPQCSVGLDCSQFQTCDRQLAATSADQGLSRRRRTTSLCSPQSSKYRDTSGVSTQPCVIVRQERCTPEKVVRYSKAQRPTSLPIQPLVLIPTDQPPSQAQHLGGLLEHYIHQRSSKSSSSSSSSQPGLKSKAKNSFSHLQPSPAGGLCPVYLEAPSSSDTCSTCTPSPECLGRRRAWSRSGGSQRCPSPWGAESRAEPSGASSPEPGPVPCSRSGKAQRDTFLNRSSLVRIPTCQDLIHLTPEQSRREPDSPLHLHDHVSYHSMLAHTPPTLASTADTRHLNPRVSVSPPSEKTLPRRRATPSAHSALFHGGFAAAAPLSSLLSAASSGLRPQQSQQGSAVRADSLILSDRPPVEFCLSPDTSYESLSISHLQRRGLLRSVSKAVDLIMAHFGTSRDPEEKMRLGNSSWSPTVAGLVLEHLCPAIQNILEDGLRDHKLDLIVGQRRNHSWTVVEVSTVIGPSTRVLHSLVTKIRQCPQLTSHCMRLRAFIMGLLNLRALEFWLSHIQSQRNVVTTYYHSWGFLSMSLERCQPLFLELLLLLQPLSVLSFDLNLLLEPRMLRNKRLCPEEQGVTRPQPCSSLLVTSCPLLRAERKADNIQGTKNPHLEPNMRRNSSCITQPCDGTQAPRSPWLASIPEWGQKEPDLMDGVAEGEDCSLNYADNWSQISMGSGQEETRRDKDTGTPSVPTGAPVESPCQGGLRWAKLFGAAHTSTGAELVSRSHMGAQTKRRPSAWLHFDRSQLGLLAQSIKSMARVGAHVNKNKDP